MPSKNNSGFTLLEVMIAISITALIGISSTNLLSNIIESKKVTDIRSEQLVTLQRFNQFVSRDVEQIINRRIRDQYGEPLPALMLDTTDYLAEWSRLGWRNSPISEDPRSTIQRIAFQTYDINDEECEPAKDRLEDWGEREPEGLCLIRYFWPVLDRAGDTEPNTQIILDLIEEIEIEVLVETQKNSSDTQSTQSSDAPAQQTWHFQFPNLLSEGNKEIPIAMRWRLTLPKIGKIERLWLIAYDDQ